MKIQMLGTGSAFAKKYYNNNALLTAEAFTLLLDCGITAPAALHRLGIPLASLDGILISHLHGDHVGGLEEIAFRMKFELQRKPVLYIPEPLADTLWNHTLKGTMQTEEAQTLDDYFEVHRLGEGVVHPLHPGIQVELMQTEHIKGKSSYSFVFNDKLFYTADMRFAPELVTDMVRRRDCIVFHDCQLHPPGAVHAALDELLTLPEDVQSRIYLMHYGDDRDDFVGRTGAMTFVEQHQEYEF
ncbi:MBL fold metallo-hydrolase [Paenibacillus tarimensis]|uniref:MBL fold metallo-hydrolase n=1 Tax=Paenibacillus tarimensis TaxID=416012 RepID=UPI0022854909|nr:MBL fold metallo-hydrolase [Paenibacillus tarimensis]